MNYTAKDNVIFISPRTTDSDQNPLAATDAGPLSESVPAVPIDTCGHTKHSIHKHQQMIADLSEHDAGRLIMNELKSRWSVEYQSFHGMRYTRTGPKGDCTRHPAFDTFQSFLFHVGPKNHPTDTLDKLDPSNPEYGPGLVRWASKSTQSHNRRNVKPLIDTQGNSYSIAEWSRKTDIPESTIRGRLKAGKTIDEALYTPVGGFSRESKSAPTDTGKYLTLWKILLDKHHDQKFFVASGKDAKQLQQIVDALFKGKAWPDDALDLILSDWGGFTHYAERQYGAWQKAPRVPTVAYLAANVQAAGNFYLDSEKPKPVYKVNKSVFSTPLKVKPKPAEEPVPDNEESLSDYLNTLDV